MLSGSTTSRYVLTTTVTIILAMIAWGVSLTERAIQRNADHIHKLEERIGELTNETREMRVRLDVALKDKR